MMRYLLSVLLLLCWPLVTFGQTNGPPHRLDGVWQTEARDGSWGYVTMAPCGDAYCGTLTGGSGTHVDTQYFGTVMITHMRWTGSEYSGGQLLDVETRRVYQSRLRFLGPDRLQVSGCVLGGLICGGQVWARIE